MRDWKLVPAPEAVAMSFDPRAVSCCGAPYRRGGGGSTPELSAIGRQLPGTIRPAAIRRPRGGDIDAAAAALDHILRLDRRRAAPRLAACGGVARRLLEGLPDLLDAVDVFEPVPDDEDDEDEQDKLAETHRGGLGAPRRPVKPRRRES